jgi:hypothetical protein
MYGSCEHGNHLNMPRYLTREHMVTDRCQRLCTYTRWRRCARVHGDYRNGFDTATNLDIHNVAADHNATANYNYTPYNYYTCNYYTCNYHIAALPDEHSVRHRDRPLLLRLQQRQSVYSL